MVNEGLGPGGNFAQTVGMSKDNLQRHWQRHDWQQSPFAPNLRLVQALVGGETASGAGFSRYDALARCLGETAEILALKSGESSEGVAAGPEHAFARNAALKERLERWALWDWWHGHLIAVPLAAAELVAELRAGAREKRETALWYLPDFPYCRVVIARSLSNAEDQPILGFGAHSCAETAARSALIELGMMELNLPTQRPELPEYFARLMQVSASHFPLEKVVGFPPNPLRNNDNIESNLTSASIGFSLEDLTPVRCPLTVLRAVIPSAPSWGSTLGPLI